MNSAIILERGQSPKLDQPYLSPASCRPGVLICEKRNERAYQGGFTKIEEQWVAKRNHWQKSSLAKITFSFPHQSGRCPDPMLPVEYYKSCHDGTSESKELLKSLEVFLKLHRRLRDLERNKLNPGAEPNLGATYSIDGTDFFAFLSQRWRGKIRYRFEKWEVRESKNDTTPKTHVVLRFNKRGGLTKGEVQSEGGPKANLDALRAFLRQHDRLSCLFQKPVTQFGWTG